MYLNCRRIASFILLYNSASSSSFNAVSLAFLFFEIHSGAIGGGRQRQGRVNYVCRPHVQSPAQLLLGGAPAFIFCVRCILQNATYFSHNRFIIFNTLYLLQRSRLQNPRISRQRINFPLPCYFLIKIYIFLVFSIIKTHAAGLFGLSGKIDPNFLLNTCFVLWHSVYSFSPLAPRWRNAIFFVMGLQIYI